MPRAASFQPDAAWGRAIALLGLGGVCCLIAAGWALAGEGQLEPLRLALVWVGLLAGGIGVTAAFRTSPTSDAPPRKAPLFLLALLFAGIALGVTWVLVASWAGSYLLGVRPGLAFVLWLLVGPMSARAAWQCLMRGRAGSVLERRDRAAMGLLLGAVVAFLGCCALTTPAAEASLSWVTIQRFLFVLGLGAVAGAPLTSVDDLTRRCVLSGLFLFHFLGIVTASLGSGPGPWLAGQAWMRIYRPYLEFLYLTNAYHFYSPEPGPPSHLWFRLYYTDSQGQPQGEWYKVPRIDDDGRHGHWTSTEYFRTLSLTESAMPTETIAADSDWFAKLLDIRLAWTPDGVKKDAVVGAAPIKPELLVPMHTGISKGQQYQVPQAGVKRVLESYARHVLREHAGAHPDRRYTTVKIYRVVHRIQPTSVYFLGVVDPTDPEYYTPIYLGEHDTTGKLLSEGDPLLYWVLPILRDPPANVASPIRDWARKHAGDAYWIRIVRHNGFPEWVDDNHKAAEQ